MTSGRRALRKDGTGIFGSQESFLFLDKVPTFFLRIAY